MYGELLRSAQAAVAPAEPERSGPELRAELAHRAALCQRFDGPSGPGGAAAAIAAEVGYDLVLIELCRRAGIACGPDRYVRPADERRRLEAALAAAHVSDGGDRQTL